MLSLIIWDILDRSSQFRTENVYSMNLNQKLETLLHFPLDGIFQTCLMFSKAKHKEATGDENKFSTKQEYIPKEVERVLVYLKYRLDIIRRERRLR